MWFASIGPGLVQKWGCAVDTQAGHTLPMNRPLTCALSQPQCRGVLSLWEQLPTALKKRVSCRDKGWALLSSLA